MGIISRLWKREQKTVATPFETFLRAFADDPHLADRVIRDTKSTNRLTMAFCLACFHYGYTITTDIRKILAEAPVLPGSKPTNFAFDPVALEVIALGFYGAMAEYISDSDDDNDEDSVSEEFETLKQARYLADSLAEKYIKGKREDLFRSRLIAYSLATHKRKSVLEEATNHILIAAKAGSNEAASPINDILMFATVQNVLSSAALSSLKAGMHALYLEWALDPEKFGA